MQKYKGKNTALKSSINNNIIHCNNDVTGDEYNKKIKKNVKLNSKKEKNCNDNKIVIKKLYY